MIRFNRVALAVLAALCLQGSGIHFSGPAQAQTFTEIKYAPDVGSRWQIQSVTEGEEIKPGSAIVNQTLRSTTEVTIEEKLPDGYRASYVMKDLKIEGNPPGRELVEAAMSSMKGLVVRGRLNASGKAVAIDNFAEVKAGVAAMVDRLAKGFESKPQVANAIRQLMSGFLDVDPSRAPEIFMEDLTPLSAGQTTGIAQGSIKREESVVNTPIGGAIKSRLETRIESFDGNRVRYIRKQAFDEESIKAVTLALSEKLLANMAGKVTPEVMAQMRDVRLSIESEAVITVEGGVTRTVDDRSVTTARLMGHEMRKTEKKVMTVTRIN